MSELDRRQFLHVALQFLAASGAGLSLSACGEPRRCDESSAGLIPNLAAARDLGRLYLTQYPDVVPSQQLAQELIGGGPASDAELTRKIAERVERDFISGDIVAVDGWRLARTEADLCAIIALDLC